MTGSAYPAGQLGPASDSALVLALDARGKHPLGREPQEPLEHLACALGGCLLELVGRFQERRDQSRRARADVVWCLGGGGQLRCLWVTLWLPEVSSVAECTTLERLLETCPVHRVLSAGVPVAVSLATDLTSEAGNPMDATGSV